MLVFCGGFFAYIYTHLYIIFKNNNNSVVDLAIFGSESGDLVSSLFSTSSIWLYFSSPSTILFFLAFWFFFFF